ncbi:hypothetical protein AgCh_005621 [Apium graveolens]
MIQEPIIQLENFGEDDCHPEDQLWSQPLMYSEGEDDREWDEFLYHFSMKNRSVDEDNEKEVEGNFPTLTKQNVIVNDNVPFENFSNIPNSNVSIGPLLNDSDFDDFFAADLVDPELFSEPENDEQVVYDKIEVGLEDDHMFGYDDANFNIKVKVIVLDH